MPATTFCSVCEHPDCERINAALRAGTSLRGIEKAFSVGRTAITGHAAKHTTAPETRKYRAAAKGRGRRTKGEAAAPDIRPIHTADDVIADLQRLRIEAYGLFEAAKDRSDWKSAERVFGQLVDVVDRFGEMHRVLGSKGVTVNVDQRSIKVAALYDSLPKDVLRSLASGETTIEAVLGHALEVQS